MKKRVKSLLAQLSPPGYDADLEVKGMLLGLLLSAVIAASVFGAGLREGLKRIEVGLKYDIPSFVREAPTIGALLGGFRIFYAPAVAALLLIAVRWGYYWQGSRSIYLMRRLPARGELCRRTVGLPLVLVGVVLLAATVTAAACCAGYYIAVPAEYLPADPWGVLITAGKGA